MRKGFSLIEVLVVIVLIVILLTTAIPSLQKFFKIYKFNNYAFELENLIKWAKIVSMARTSHIWICVESNNNLVTACSGEQDCKVLVYDVETCRTKDCSNRKLLKSISIEDNWVNVKISPSSSFKCLVFDPRGIALTGGNICITENTRYYKFILQTNRGFIKVKSGEGTC